MTQLGMLQWPGELEMLDAFLQDREIRTALEIGTGAGGFTQWLAARVSYLLVTIDLPGGSSTGLQHDACLARNAQLKTEYSHLVTIMGDSHDPLVFADVCRVLEGNPVDLLFVDGDHSRAGVAQDYADYGRLVRPGGVVAFHDISADAFESHGVDVPRFWRELVGTKQELSVHGTWGGIGVLIV